jgi:ABC-type microcin C transport system permease subunit YejE
MTVDESSQAITLLLLFVGLFLSWSKALISAAIAIVIRDRAVSLALALIVGALEGLFGSRLELLDIYLTRDGWATIDALTLITVALSALASLLWWLIARMPFELMRRVGARAAN